MTSRRATSRVFPEHSFADGLDMLAALCHAALHHAALRKAQKSTRIAKAPTAHAPPSPPAKVTRKRGRPRKELQTCPARAINAAAPEENACDLAFPPGAKRVRRFRPASPYVYDIPHNRARGSAAAPVCPPPDFGPAAPVAALAPWRAAGGPVRSRALPERHSGTAPLSIRSGALPERHCGASPLPVRSRALPERHHGGSPLPRGELPPQNLGSGNGLADTEGRNAMPCPRQAETCTPLTAACAPQMPALGGSAASSYDGAPLPAAVASPLKRPQAAKPCERARQGTPPSHSDDSSGGTLKAPVLNLRLSPDTPSGPHGCDASDSDIDIDIGGEVYHEPHCPQPEDVCADRCPTPTSAPLNFTCLFRQPGSRACSPDWPEESPPEPVGIPCAEFAEVSADQPNSGSRLECRSGRGIGMTRMGSSNARQLEDAGLLDEAYQGDVGAVAGMLARRVAHLPAKALFHFVQELNGHLAGGLAVKLDVST